MTPYYPPCYALVSGGKDSFSTAQVLLDADRLLGLVGLGTGISTPEWRDHLISFANKIGAPLEFHHTTASYDDLFASTASPALGCTSSS